MRVICITILLLLFGKLSMAQLPNTNIYLFKFEQVNDSLFNFQKPQFLTHFNSRGYNNQPHFVSNNEVYISVEDVRDKSQTDIISLNLDTKVRTLVTNSEDREYSPTLLPEKYYFSCVRQENDGLETQRLWVFPIDRSTNGKVILKNQDKIGYHCWLTNETVALFIVGPPHYLALANTSDDTVMKLTSNIGRSLQKLPNGNLAFLHKPTETNWTIKELDVNTLRSKTIVGARAGSEDFIVLKDGSILMSQGSKIYKYKIRRDTRWLEVADFSKLGIDNIKRMAISPDERNITIVNSK